MILLLLAGNNQECWRNWKKLPDLKARHELDKPDNEDAWSEFNKEQTNNIVRENQIEEESSHQLSINLMDDDVGSVLTMESREKASTDGLNFCESPVGNSSLPPGRKNHTFRAKEEKVQSILGVQRRLNNTKAPNLSSSRSSVASGYVNNVHAVQPKMMPFLKMNKLDLDAIRPSTVGGMDKKIVERCIKTIHGKELGRYGSHGSAHSMHDALESQGNIQESSCGQSRTDSAFLVPPKSTDEIIDTTKVIGKKNSKGKALKTMFRLSQDTHPDLQLIQLLEYDNVIRQRAIPLGDIEAIEHGLELEKENEMDDALKYYRKLKRRFKFVQIPTTCVGIILFKQGKYLQAIKEFNDAIKFQSTLPRAIFCADDDMMALYNRALCHFRTGNDGLAIDDLEQSLKLNDDKIISPPHEDSILQVRRVLVIAYRRLGKFEKSIKFSDIVISADDSKHSRNHRRHDSRHKEHIKEPKIQPQMSLVPGLYDVDVTDKPILASAPIEKPGKSEGDNVGVHASSSQNSPSCPSAASGPSAPVTRSRANTDLSKFLGDIENDGNSPGKKMKTRERQRDREPPDITRRKNIPTHLIKGQTSTGLLSHVAKKPPEKNEINLKWFKGTIGMTGLTLHEHMFERLTELQDALITPPFERSKTELETITKRLRLIPFLANLDVKKMNSLAQCIEYRVVPVKQQLFEQNRECEAMCIVMSGHVQVKLDLPPNMAPLPAILDYYENGVFGHLDLLFHQDCPIQPIDHIFNMKGHRHAHAIDDNNDGYVNRAEVPSWFSSHHVQSQSEILFVSRLNFNALLTDQALDDLKTRIEVISACGVFNRWPKLEILRMARMGIVRGYKPGEIIIEQGKRNEHLYFIIRGVCGVQKRADKTEILGRLLQEAKNKASIHDQKYSFHHRLRNNIAPVRHEDMISRHAGVHVDASSTDHQHQHFATSTGVSGVDNTVTTVTGIATSGENNEEQIHIDKNASPMRRYSHYNCILFICFSNYHRPPSVPLPSFHVCNFLETKMATATL